MIESTPNIVWFSGSLAFTACASAFILSIQKGLQHKGIRLEEDSNSSSQVKDDYKRDTSVPYADTNRLTRITCCTLLLAALSAIDFFDNVQTNNQNMWHITCSIFIFISWLYASVLALTSRRFELPNQWGWTLNVHLFVLYLMGWVVSIYQFYEIVLIQHPNMDWIHCLPYILKVVLGFDLVYVTATVKQGPPFLDENDRQVCNVNVESIIGILFLNWCSSVVNISAAKKNELVDKDLPVLTPKYRAINLLRIFNLSRGQNLIWRLIQANRFAFITQISLTIPTSGLYYIPIFLMNRLLQFLQDYNNGVHFDYPILQGITIVIGMGVSIIVLGFFLNQQWYYGGFD
jgi:hypothetical protein